MTLTSSNLQNTKKIWLNSAEKIQVAAWLAASNDDCTYIYTYVDLAVSDEAYKAHLKRLKKRERKCMSGNSNLSIEDFAIPISALQEQHIKLMRLIGWISYVGSIIKAEGFYAESGAGAVAGETYTRGYITVEKYAEFLTLEFNLIGCIGGLNGDVA